MGQSCRGRGTEAEAPDGQLFGSTIEAEVSGGPVQTAKNQPMAAERIEKQLNKTGNTPFYFQSLQVETEGNCFIPVQELNELRRNAFEKLETQILSQFRRQEPSGHENGEGDGKKAQEGNFRRGKFSGRTAQKERRRAENRRFFTYRWRSRKDLKRFSRSGRRPLFPSTRPDFRLRAGSRRF